MLSTHSTHTHTHTQSIAAFILWSGKCVKSLHSIS